MFTSLLSPVFITFHQDVATFHVLLHFYILLLCNCVFLPTKSIFNPIPRLGHLFSSCFPLESNFHPDVPRWPRITGPTASNAVPCNVPRAWSKRIIARWSDSSRSNVTVINSCVILSTVFWSLLYDIYIYMYSDL